MADPTSSTEPLIENIKYTPPPSIGHEMGIMFGFLGLMAVSMGLYLVGWQHGNIRGQRKEIERIETLRASGFLRQRQEEVEGVEKRSSGEEGHSSEEMHMDRSSS